MSEICKNWTQWLKKNRFAGQTPEMQEQTMRWLEAVRDVILVYAEIHYQRSNGRIRERIGRDGTGGLLSGKV